MKTNKFIKIKVQNFKSICPVCGQMNDHLTGNVCKHVKKVTVKHIVFYLNN